MALMVRLPRSDRQIMSYEVSQRIPVAAPPGSSSSRVAYAAAHVVADPMAEGDPTSGSALDWEATLAYRRYLWSCGLGIAEAMDTAQRGMGLPWPVAHELIQRSVVEARACGGLIACGAGTDHLEAGPSVTLDDVVRAYTEQCAAVEGTGSRIIVMASRALAACARGPDDYRRVYGTILAQVTQPVILHWLGAMFDPALAGYWGFDDLDQATEVCLSLITDYSTKVEGIKISLLDDAREIALRRRLPDGIRMYTGDDFNYPALIRGDAQGHSDALLGIFDAIAPVAAARVTRSRRRGRGALLCTTGPHRDTLAPHFCGTNTLLQDRHCFSSLSQRSSNALPDDRGIRERPLRGAPGQTFRAGGWCRAITRP